MPAWNDVSTKTFRVLCFAFTNHTRDAVFRFLSWFALDASFLHCLQKSVALAFDKSFFCSDKVLDFAVIGLKSHRVSGFYGVEDLRHANIQSLELGMPVSFKESDLLACYQVIIV